MRAPYARQDRDATSRPEFFLLRTLPVGRSSDHAKRFSCRNHCCPLMRYEARHSRRPSSDDAPSRVPGRDPWSGSAPTPRVTELATCTTVPVSSGPLARLVRLELTAPTADRCGATVAVSASLSATVATQRVVTVPGQSAVLIVGGGVVVGAALGRAGPAVPLALRADEVRPAQSIPTAVPLVARRTDDGDTVNALPAGRYQLVAVLGYCADGLNTGTDNDSGWSTARVFRLVGAPVQLVVN